MKTRRLIAAAFLAIVALAAANVVLYRATSSAEQKVDAGAAAAKASKTSVPQLLSYDYRSIDDDLARARTRATGRFVRELRTLQTKVVRPSALDKKVVTKTVVVNAAVVSQGTDRVELLVFAVQMTKATDTPTQQETRRLAIVMEKSGDRWLISSLEPI